MTYDTSYGAIQAIYRPLTPTRNETGAFFTYACPFLPDTQCPMCMNRSKVRYEDEINAENQKLFKSLTDKWYR